MNGKELDKSVIGYTDKILEELYSDDPYIYNRPIEVEWFDPSELSDSSKKLWAYTKIYDDLQRVYLPHPGKLRGLLPEVFWLYLEGGTLKVKDKYIKVKRKVENPLAEFLKYLFEHEATHPKYTHIGDEKTEEVLTELEVLRKTKDPNARTFREYLHAYCLYIGQSLSKDIAKVEEGVREKYNEYKNYMESLGFNNQPAEVKV